MSIENKQHSYFHIAIIVLLVINIAVSVLSMQSAENLEVMKVGWKENYAKLQTIMQSEEYKQQYAQNLELMLQQIQGGANNELMPTSSAEGEIPSDSTTDEILPNSWTIVDNNVAQGDE